MYTPDKGDIVWFNFDPSTGKEIMKRRPAFVLSRKAFNRHTGFAIVAPITSTKRGMKLEVVLPDTLKTKGAVLVHQLRSLDYRSRQVELIEKSSDETISKVTDISLAIIS